MTDNWSPNRDQNNLYPEDPNFAKKNKGSYKPLIPEDYQYRGDKNETQETQQEEYSQQYSQQINPNPQQNQNYDYQTQNPFDTNLNQQQTQKTFNKDIEIKPQRNRLKESYNFIIRHWILSLVVVLALAVIGLLLWQVLRPDDLRTGTFNNVEATIQAPESSPSGSPSLWKIEIINNENVDLLNVQLDLTFDSDFQFSRSITPDPSDPKGDQFFFNRIDAANKAGGTPRVIVEFEGVLIGQIEDETTIQAQLSYTPEPWKELPNNREQVDLESAITKITQPLVTGLISPDTSEVEADTEARIKVNFENLSDRELNNLRIEMTYPNPEIFEYISSELLLSNSSSPRTDPSNGNNMWQIDTLPRSGVQELIIVGKLDGVINTEYTFTLDIQLQQPDQTYQSIFTTDKNIRVVSRPLSISTFIAGKQDQKTFKPGESLTFQIDYRNQSNAIINNIELIASINDPAEILDFSTLRYVNKINGNESNNTITWGGQSAPFLASMRPGVEGNIQFRIQVKEDENFINLVLSQGSYTLIPKAEAMADNIRPVIAQGDIYRAEGSLNFSDEVTFRESPDNPDIRIYTIKWQIETAQNRYNNLQITTSTSLPTSAWQPNSIGPTNLANNLQYNSSNGQIQLNLDELESLLGISRDAFTIQFDLQVAKQVGSFDNIELHREVNLQATDDFTGEVVRQKLRKKVVRD